MLPRCFRPTRRHIAQLAVACVVLGGDASGRFGFSAMASAQGEIPWQTDVERASAAAVRSNRPMLLEFWADWCPPCKVMDEEVYTETIVIRAMDRLVPVKINVDQQDTVARKYDLAGMPTLVFTDSYGNELFRFTGLINATTMVQLLQELPDDVTPINRLTQAISKNKNDFAALDALGRTLRESRLYRSSNTYYGRALKLRPSRDPEGHRGRILMAMGQNHLELREFTEAASVFDRYLKEVPGGPAEAEAMLGLGRAQLSQNKRAEATRTLRALTNKYTSGPISVEASRLLANP